MIRLCLRDRERKKKDQISCRPNCGRTLDELWDTRDEPVYPTEKLDCWWGGTRYLGSCAHLVPFGLRWRLPVLLSKGRTRYEDGRVWNNAKVEN